VGRLEFRWDASMAEKLERLIHEGLDCSTIARRFGCTPTTIAARARQLAELRERERRQREVEAA
jgi:hypothetical protein